MQHVHTQANIFGDLHTSTHTVRHMPLLKVMIHNIWRSRAFNPVAENTQESVGLVFDVLIHGALQI